MTDAPGVYRVCIVHRRRIMPAMNAAEPHDQKRCLGCGYVLDNLPEPRCPECGREFDPNDARTYLPKPRRGWPYLLAAILCTLGFPSLFVTLSFVIESSTGRRLGQTAFISVILAVALAFIGTAVVLAASIRAMRWPRFTFRRRRPVVAAVVLSGLTMALWLGLVLVGLVGAR